MQALLDAALSQDCGSFRWSRLLETVFLPLFRPISGLTRLLPSLENQLGVQLRRGAGKGRRANLAQSVDVRLQPPLVTRPPNVYAVLLRPSILQPWRRGANRWWRQSIYLNHRNAFRSRLAQQPLFCRR